MAKEPLEKMGWRSLKKLIKMPALKGFILPAEPSAGDGKRAAKKAQLIHSYSTQGENVGQNEVGDTRGKTG